MLSRRDSKRPLTACSKKKRPSNIIRYILHKYNKPIQKLPSSIAKELSDLPQASTTKYNFSFLHVVGKGGFGRVWKVQQKRTKKSFALKEMLKLRIVSKRSVNSVMNERRLLEQLHHSFIVNMHYAFQDRESLFLVLDLMPGGDLRYHIGRRRKFTELETQFMVACIVTGLGFLHKNRIIHRDIKPENLVLDSKGYVKITDFGIARVLSTDNARENSGTPGYMAPEVMIRQNHGTAVDYFAVGVIAYEFMMGRRPYIGRNRKEIRDHILSKQAQVRRHELPEGWSLEAADFINRMIQRKASSRLGAAGVEEVKSHVWLRNFPWDELLQGKLQAPFVPKDEDNFDSRVNNEWDDEVEPTVALATVQKLFEGYSYENRKSLLFKSKCNS